MMRPDELGMLRAGYLADVVMVDGNPLEDLSLLVDPARICLVMKDGQIHKDASNTGLNDAALHRQGADFPLQEEGIHEALAGVES